MLSRLSQAFRIRTSAWWIVLATSFSSSSLVAQSVNSWVNPKSSNWDQATNWSLGTLPASSQSIMITNSGWKAVSISPSTPVNWPGSMTVNSLAIRGAWDTMNVLLLNHIGTTAPLTVLNGLMLQDMAQIVNLNSGLVVQSGTITVTNAQVIQDGGFIRATNSTMYLQNAEYNLTNGTFDGGIVLLGSRDGPSAINQHGGAVAIANFGFLGGPGFVGSSYTLHGGYLYLPGGLRVTGEYGAAASYLQTGGTNGTTQVLVEPGLYGTSPEFRLTGGLLADNSVAVMGDNFGKALFEHKGGTHTVADTLGIAGGSIHGQDVQQGMYRLADGVLSARTIELNGNQGDALFVQTNGTTGAGTVWAHSVGWYASFNVSIILAGGSLTCSNLTVEDGRGVLHQTGGALVVSNLLEVGGFRDVGFAKYYGSYILNGGTLTASNINITGDWFIGDSNGASRINNSGFCRLSHMLVIGNAVEQLGRFILASNATLNLAGGAGRLSFANSSGESWSSSATLVVSNWNGSVSGGDAEQLKFGTSNSGLTQSQLSQISFRIGSDFYSAKILNTGEVVPDQVLSPSITFARQGNNFVLSWPSGFSLQTSTNAAGPYSTIPAATSPYTNDMRIDQQRFYRLVQ